MSSPSHMTRRRSTGDHLALVASTPAASRQTEGRGESDAPSARHRNKADWEGRSTTMRALMALGAIAAPDSRTDTSASMPTVRPAVPATTRHASHGYSGQGAPRRPTQDRGDEGHHHEHPQDDSSRDNASELRGHPI
jgi:hypothetical protein